MSIPPCHTSMIYGGAYTPSFFLHGSEEWWVNVGVGGEREGDMRRNGEIKRDGNWRKMRMQRDERYLGPTSRWTLYKRKGMYTTSSPEFDF